MYLQLSYLYFLCLANTIGWKPPGMDDIKRQTNGMEESDFSTEPPTEAHDHSDNIDVADLVIDTEHLMDDIGDVYSKKDFEKMGTDEKVFMWFNAHDWDLDTCLDGSELLKALSHDHNYHHSPEEAHTSEENSHDPAQHTESADKQRFRRTVRIVDRLLADHDPDKNGLVTFSEFMTAFHGGKLEGLKLRQIQKKSQLSIDLSL